MQFIPADINHRSHPRLDWFEERRDFFIRQAFADYFVVFQSFQELYQLYISSRDPVSGACCDLSTSENEELRGLIWNKLTLLVGSEEEKGILWNLKDLCHRLWSDNDSEKAGHGLPHNREGTLIDYLIGSIFHETVKLKENIYILNCYGSDGVRRIVAGVIDQLGQLAFLLGQTGNRLRCILPDLAQNMLLVRLLVEEEEQLLRIWGEDSVDVLSDMFWGEPAHGFCAAGKSYMSGQWYSKALPMFERAMELDRGCDEARTKTYLLRAIIDENSSLLGAHSAPR